MKKNLLLTLVLCSVFVLLLSLPVVAQEELVTIPVSGTFNYTPTLLANMPADGKVFFSSFEDEQWFGDLEGTAVAQFRAVLWNNGVMEGPGFHEWEGTVLGEYEGTLQIMSTFRRNALTAEWYGEWWILRGTGDLAGLHGRGVYWGPGFNPEDPEAEPDIYYAGEIVFVEAPDS